MKEIDNVFVFITTIVICCCCCCQVQCQQQQQQQLQQQQQQQPHKYQQLQYQMQQQQQYEYQQQMQQQQQQHLHYQQQYQQQQQEKKTTELQKQQQQQHLAPPTSQQSQMLKTGASLVVDDDSANGGIDSTELSGTGPLKDYYASNGPLSDTKQTTNRRRPGNTRKRKRRPQFAEAGSSVAAPAEEDAASQYWRGHVEDDMMPTASSTSSRDDSRSSASSTIRKRKQPAVREPLAALEKEQKLYELRDKQRHDLVTDVAGNQRNKAYRRPYSQAKKDSHQLTSTAETLPNTAGVATQNSKTSVELKNILKNSGGLSLSEILQQKNLSLDDLLKGKQNALLALQTTAAAPSNSQKYSDSNQKQQVKPIRRIPYFGAASSTATTAHTEDASVGSGETIDETESDDPQMIKSKLKTPALQRLKLFGTSSRASATTGNGTTPRRREPINSTTTTTTTTTTRVPIYKKRLPQQRPTLKSPLLFKVPSSVSTTKEVPTSIETLITTNTNNNRDQDREDRENEDGEGNDDDEQEEQETEKYLKNEAENEDNKDENENEESTVQSITTPTTTTQKPPKLTTTNRISTIPAATSATTTIGSSKNLSSVHLNPRVELQEFNFKKNVIETNDEKPTKPTTTQPKNSENDSSKFNEDELENFFGEEDYSPPPRNNTQSKETNIENITPRIDRYPPKPTSYLEHIPDFDGVDDRTDLLELIEDRRSGNRLFKVLEQRNMTLEELIEHRKRGSSALHLSTIVESERSRLFPGQKVVLHDNMDIVTAFENFPHFNLMDLKSVKPDDIKTDSQGSSYFTSIIDIEPTDEIYKDDKGSSSNGDNGVRGPAYLPPQRTEKSIGFFPSWKTLALASLATTTRDAVTKRNPFFLPQPQLFLDNNSAELDTDEFVFNGNDNDTNPAADTKPSSLHATAIDTAEAIENEVSRAHDLLDLELSGHGFKRSPAAAAASMSKPGNLYANMPAGIRSAIVASAAIVLTSMATFMVIFVVCRWKQHRRRKTNYMKTYNAMKSKLPTIETTSRRSSMRNNMAGMMGDGGAVGISTVSSPSPVHQLQRQSSLLFPRGTSDTTTTIMSGSCTNAGRGTGSSSKAAADRIGFGSSEAGGIFCGGSRTGSTTSLALSLQSVHNLSTTKLNTMDPNSPEVHEYLFDTLRKSF